MPKDQADNLLTLPKNAGRAIVETGSVVTCPLLGTDKFIKFCRNRGVSIDHKRLLRLERLGLFAPFFRVRMPPRMEVSTLTIPAKMGGPWFAKGWAWDTTGIGLNYAVPDVKDHTQEAYYSAFQIDYLELVLSSVTLPVFLDDFLEHAADDEPDWNKCGKSWLKFVRDRASNLRIHEYRRSAALLCQYISDRYYPKTQGNQRTIQVPQGPYFHSDPWIRVYARDWNWDAVVRKWNPKKAERLFKLTPEKLRHVFEGMSVSQAHRDPLEKWYQLVQFVSVRERKTLKGDALFAETIRSGAHMLRMLYKDLYGEELPHPNEVTGTIITHAPELAVREDTRRYLEFVANRYDLNPQPIVALIVEGNSEQAAVVKIFEVLFGSHPGKLGIEIIVLGGVDAATGTPREDRFRAIFRLIDYLHHHQTFSFLILDNERYARKLKAEAHKAKSIHHTKRFVTRPEYIKVWRRSFEFDNFSSTEIAAALGLLSGKRFSTDEIEKCKSQPYPGAELKRVYRSKSGHNLNKTRLAEVLVENMLSKAARKKPKNRPIIQTLERVTKMAMRNPLPTMLEVWETNQQSRYLGKKVR